MALHESTAPEKSLEELQQEETRALHELSGKLKKFKTPHIQKIVEKLMGGKQSRAIIEGGRTEVLPLKSQLQALKKLWGMRAEWFELLEGPKNIHSYSSQSLTNRTQYEDRFKPNIIAEKRFGGVDMVVILNDLVFKAADTKAADLIGGVKNPASRLKKLERLIKFLDSMSPLLDEVVQVQAEIARLAKLEQAQADAALAVQEAAANVAKIEEVRSSLGQLFSSEGRDTAEPDLEKFDFTGLDSTMREAAVPFFTDEAGIREYYAPRLQADVLGLKDFDLLLEGILSGEIPVKDVFVQLNDEDIKALQSGNFEETLKEWWTTDKQAEQKIEDALKVHRAFKADWERLLGKTNFESDDNLTAVGEQKMKEAATGKCLELMMTMAIAENAQDKNSGFRAIPVSKTVDGVAVADLILEIPDKNGLEYTYLLAVDMTMKTKAEEDPNGIGKFAPHTKDFKINAASARTVLTKKAYADHKDVIESPQQIPLEKQTLSNPVANEFVENLMHAFYDLYLNSPDDQDERKIRKVYNETAHADRSRKTPVDLEDWIVNEVFTSYGF